MCPKVVRSIRCRVFFFFLNVFCTFGFHCIRFKKGERIKCRKRIGYETVLLGWYNQSKYFLFYSNICRVYRVCGKKKEKTYRKNKHITSRPTTFSSRVTRNALYYLCLQNTRKIQNLSIFSSLYNSNNSNIFYVSFYR